MGAGGLQQVRVGFADMVCMFSLASQSLSPDLATILNSWTTLSFWKFQDVHYANQSELLFDQVVVR